MEVLRRFWFLLAKYAADQRGFAGDAGDDDKGGDQDDSGKGDDDADLKGAIEDDVFKIDLSEIIVDEGDDDADKDKGGKKSDDKKKAGEKGDQADDKPDTEKEAKILEEKVERLKKAKRGLERDLHDFRQEKKGLKGKSDEKDFLSDAQIDAILEQHKDDPATIRNVIKHIAQKEAQGVKKDAMSEADTLSRKKDADALLRQRIKNFDEEDSEERAEIMKVKEKLGLDEHPMGDLLSAGFIAFNLSPKIYEAGVAAGKKMALSEKGRKEDIKDGQLPKGKGGDGKGASVSKASAEVIKQMNLNPRASKIYQRLITGKPNSVSMEE